MIARYSSPEMQRVWSEENKYQSWLEVEIAICEAMAEIGRIPKADVEAIRQRSRFEIDRILELEKTTRHDVMAFVRNVAENVGDEGRWIHFGVTSYDVVDTALALRLRQAIELIISEAKTLSDTIRRRAIEHKRTVMIGRTHGVHAEPITFGFKLAGWHAEMRRNLERLERAKTAVSVGKVSGAVGIHGNADPHIEELVCQRLGLQPDPVSTQIVNRDRHAEFMSALAILAGSLERYATELRNLQRTEILETQEAFAKGQTGSSAMPHKRNPWNCETVAGLARVVRGYSLAMFESISTWHERDLTNSSVERIVIPDACLAVDFMLRKFNEILENLYINTDRMAQNLALMGQLSFSEHVMLALVSAGLPRERAYELVQRNAAKAWEGGSFLDSLITDPDVREVLSASSLRTCCDIDHHLRNLDAIFERAFAD